MSENLTKMYYLFNDGDFKTVFSGKDGFFIKDRTWGTHDTQLVFLHLFKWLNDGNNGESNISKIKDALENIITMDVGIDKVSNGLWSLQLLVDYCIEADCQNYWPIDKKNISELISKVPLNKDEWDKYNVKKDINRVKQFLGVHSV